jgi:hypothetical protein
MITRNIHSLLVASLLVAVLIPMSVSAQSNFTCSVKGSSFNGKIKEAVLVQINKEKFIQLNVVDGDKILYLYIKTSKINDLPVTLNYVQPDTNNIAPESEIIWAPDGPENPQWNAVEGKTLITEFDPEKKIISGTFEFKVEKFDYTSDVNQSRPSMEITDGKFTNITYKVEAPGK